MTPEQMQLLSNIIDQAFLLARSCDKMRAIADLTRAVAEQHNALRWRKQSEEPAPSSIRVIERLPGYAAQCCFGCEVRPMAEWLPVPP